MIMFEDDDLDVDESLSPFSRVSSQQEQLGGGRFNGRQSAFTTRFASSKMLSQTPSDKILQQRRWQIASQNPDSQVTILFILLYDHFPH
jgi:hypothetical protein